NPERHGGDPSPPCPKPARLGSRGVLRPWRACRPQAGCPHPQRGRAVRRNTKKKGGKTAAAASAPARKHSPPRADADDADRADDLLPSLAGEPAQADGTPSAVTPQGSVRMAADEAFRQRIEALPVGEQLAEIALEAERRGVEAAQPGVVHITIFRDQ